MAGSRDADPQTTGPAAEVRTLMTRAVARISPDATLRELATKKKQLIREYLDKANQFFQRQNLSAAAPYYRRVLVLDPENKRASEGLRMHENLERIRRQRGHKR